jgi:hypothetical protein
LEDRIAMKRQLTAGVIAAVVLGGCHGAAPASVADAGVAADRAVVERTTTAFHDALRMNDIETFMSYVAEDVIFMPPGEPPVRGRDAVHRWMTAFSRSTVHPR